MTTDWLAVAHTVTVPRCPRCNATRAECARLGTAVCDAASAYLEVANYDHSTVEQTRPLHEAWVRAMQAAEAA